MRAPEKLKAISEGEHRDTCGSTPYGLSNESAHKDSDAIPTLGKTAGCAFLKLPSEVCTKSLNSTHGRVGGSDPFYEMPFQSRHSQIPPTAVGGWFRFYLQRVVLSTLRAQRAGGKKVCK